MLKLLPLYARIKERYFATHIDEAGGIATRELSALAFGAEYKVKRLEEWLREWGKDVTELYLAGHTLGDTGISQEPLVLWVVASQ